MKAKKALNIRTCGLIVVRSEKFLTLREAPRRQRVLALSEVRDERLGHEVLTGGKVLSQFHPEPFQTHKFPAMVAQL